MGSSSSSERTGDSARGRLWGVLAVVSRGGLSVVCSSRASSSVGIVS